MYDADDDEDEDARNDDDASGDMLHVNYLTTCIEPFRSYIPSPENQYRVPFGNVRITFDGGGGMFNNKTGGFYPGYDPDNEFTFQFDLQGLPSSCDGCRIQVNSGMTCDLPEIRFWDRSVEGAVNPWRPEWGAVYHSNQNGQARGYFSMFDGFRYDDHKSRTVVVFDRDKSTRIGCGVIRRSTFGECGNELDSGPSMYPSASPVDVSLPPEFMPSSAPVPLTAEPQPPDARTEYPTLGTITAEPQPPEARTEYPTLGTITAEPQPPEARSEYPTLGTMTAEPQPPEARTEYPTLGTHTECPTPPVSPQTPIPVVTVPPLQTPPPSSPLIPDPSLPTPCPTDPPIPAIAPYPGSPPPIAYPEGKGVAPPADSGGKGSEIPEGRNRGKGMGESSSKGKKGGKKEMRLRNLLSEENPEIRNHWSGV